MHDILSPSTHGIIDYVTVIAFALAPTLFQFGGVPAAVAYGLAGVHLVMTLATRFPMGMFEGVPLRAHGVIELVVSAALIILPWVAGFVQPGAQWFFPVMGVSIFVIWLLSDYGRLHPVPEALSEGRSAGPPNGALPGTLPAEEDIRQTRPPESAGRPSSSEDASEPATADEKDSGTGSQG